MDWLKEMTFSRILICDKSYYQGIKNIYLKNFFEKVTHYFVDEKFKIEDLKKYSSFSFLLFSISNDNIKKQLKLLFNCRDCLDDLNILAMEMTLMPLEIYILAHKLCKTVCEILEKHKIDYYPTGGTKIGIVRNKTLLPWDWDLDFVILDTKKNVLPKIENDLVKNNIIILDGKPLPKDFKLRFNNPKSIYLDMLHVGEKRSVPIKKFPCSDYLVNISIESKLNWKEWEEYIEIAYFYCYLVYIYMGRDKYNSEGNKIYEDLSKENRLHISTYKNYLEEIFSRYKS